MLLIVASVCCVTLGPAFVAGVVRAIPSAIAAVILGGTVLIRDRSLPRRVSVLWLMGIGASLALLPRNPQPGVPWRWRTPLPASLVMGLTTSLAPGADGPYRDTSGGTMHSTNTRAPDHPRRRPQARPTRHGSGHHRVPAGTPETRP